MEPERIELSARLSDQRAAGGEPVAVAPCAHPQRRKGVTWDSCALCRRSVTGFAGCVLENIDKVGF